MPELKINERTEAAKGTFDAAKLPRALRGGTEAMRDAGTLYLPKWPKEDDLSWKARRDSSFLFNGYSQAVDSHVGKVFSHGVELAEDVPEEIVGWWENLDLGGQHGDIFSAHAFGDSLDAGIGFIFTDFPVTSKQRSKAEERQLGLRPYCSYVPADNLLGWRSARVGGVEVLTMVRMLEETVEPEGDWGEELVKRVRVVRLVPGSQFATFSLRRVDSEGREVEEDSGVMTNMKRIPLRPFYARRFGLMQGRPWLRALAWKNLEHWQSSSDQRAGLHVARVAALKVIGTSASEFAEAQGTAGLGHGTVVFVPQVGGDVGFLQYDAGGLTVGERDLAKIEEQMSILGLEPLMHRPGNPTATAKSIDESRANSRLLEAARAYGDTLEGVFEDMAMWAKLKASGSAAVNEDFGLTLQDAEDLKALVEARKMGDVSRETFLLQLHRRVNLGSDFEVEAEQQRIDEEAMTPGPEGQSRAIARAALQREGRSEEEIDAMLDGAAVPVGGSNGNGAGAAA